MSKPHLRSSQVITTFGPGAMVDLPDASVIIAGLDHWKYDNTHIPVIDESRLTEKLKHILDLPALTLRSPPPASDRGFGLHPDIVAWRFPEWFIVQHRRSVLSPEGARRRRLIHLNSLE